MIEQIALTERTTSVSKTNFEFQPRTLSFKMRLFIRSLSTTIWFSEKIAHLLHMHPLDVSNINEFIFIILETI